MIVLAAPDWGLLATLFGQFALISLLAFGGGQAVLPLMERVSVAQHAWTTPEAFTSGVGFGYLIPGPVMTVATFIGFQAGGVWGALAATLGMFLAPVALAALAAAGAQRSARNRWIRAFGLGAAPAVIGLLVATAWNLARASVMSAPTLVIALAALLLTARTKISPVWLLFGAAVLGVVTARFRIGVYGW